MATSASTAVAIRVCYRLFSRESRVTRVLAESSYSVFLFHHAVVILFGMIMLDAALWIGVKFLFVAVATLVTTFAMHHLLITRFRVTRMLFNGKA